MLRFPDERDCSVEELGVQSACKAAQIAQAVKNVLARV